MRPHTAFGAVVAAGALVQASLTNLFVEFDGFVDADKVVYVPFCSAMWKTYNLSSWDEAVDHCNATTPDFTVHAVRDRAIVIEQPLRVVVPKFATLNANLTENLRYTGFLDDTESVRHVSDVGLNRGLVVGMSGLILSVVLVAVTIYFCSSL